jgi:hypothetical protein
MCLDPKKSTCHLSRRFIEKMLTAFELGKKNCRCELLLGSGSMGVFLFQMHVCVSEMLCVRKINVHCPFISAC